MPETVAPVPSGILMATNLCEQSTFTGRRHLDLTKQTAHSWKMAEEITNFLAKFDSKDPVKYGKKKQQ